MAIQQTRQAKFNALLAPRMKARLGDAEYSTEEYWDAVSASAAASLTLLPLNRSVARPACAGALLSADPHL
jgi:hypothetical protein